MPDISKIVIRDIEYEIKDEELREGLDRLLGVEKPQESRGEGD